MATAAVPAPAAASRWVRPVDAPVVAPFVAPVSTYGPGHRGVDFAVPAGTAVRAAGDGVVTFAGEVAGTLHVVVAHTGGLRTSYSFLARVDVRTGTRVARGQLVGASGGDGPPDERGRLHFGLRVGDRYVDPMLLFRPVDLGAVVHLAPVEGDAGPTSIGAAPVAVTSERLALARDLGLFGAVPSWALGDDRAGVGVSGHLAGRGASLLGRAWSATAGLARRGISLVEQFPELAVKAWRRAPQAALLSALTAVSERLVSWWRSRQTCSDPSPAR